MNEAEEALVQAEAARLRFDPWKLRCWRASKDLTCQQLADLCEMNGRAALEVSRWETYHTVVGRQNLTRIAVALDIPENSLLSDAAEYAEHVKKYERWVAAKRPKLHKWLEQNS